MKNPHVVLGQPDSLAARSTKKIYLSTISPCNGEVVVPHLRAGGSEAVEQTVSSDVCHQGGAHLSSVRENH